jgi:hypothetical protein
VIEITEDEMRVLKGPNQIFDEWKCFLQFSQAYFKYCGIARPVVVEIGTQNGHQKAHYEKFLDAEHIGIDISDEWSMPDILGDSHAPETMDQLALRLNGRPINLLFIDAFHTEEAARAEYELYGPMTSDIIAFHDIRHEKGIGDLWANLRKQEAGNTSLSFMTIGAWGQGWCELGIGIIAKRGKEDMREIIKAYRELRSGRP